MISISVPLKWKQDNDYDLKASTALGIVAIIDATSYRGEFIVEISIFGNDFKEVRNIPQFTSLDQVKGFIQKAHDLKLAQILNQDSEDNFQYEYLKLLNHE